MNAAQHEAQLLKMLVSSGYTHLRKLAGRFAGLHEFNFTVGLVVGLEDGGYERRYCYEHAADALAALEAWDGAEHPPGPWIKMKGAGIDLLNPLFGVDAERPYEGARMG